MKSIKSKLYIILITIILIIATSSLALSYLASRKQTDSIYKSITTSNANIFASTLDGDYLKELCELAKSNEYQAIRAKAAKEFNDEPIRQYLDQKGMLEKYLETRTTIAKYINTVESVKYLYIIANEGPNATEDMFIIDDPNETFYDSTGRYEKREKEFLGKNLLEIEPTISYSDEWGWLCSDYAPVYDSKGDIVCLVGCDVEFVTIINARKNALFTNISITTIITVACIAISLILIRKDIIRPLKLIASEITNFRPTGDSLTSGVIGIPELTNRQDEIGQIYNNIRENQFEIVDYVKSITDMKEDLNEKDMKISKLSVASFKDALTSVGNRGAYLNKLKELDKPNKEYAIVMIDVNNLKEMNDKYGHRSGDRYLQNCCKLICNVFTHSPVYRIGGDEFIVVVENQDYVNRQQKFEELEKAFEISYQKETDKPWERLSASCGMADKSSEDISSEVVFKKADELMYKNKAKFKDQYGSYR